MFNGPPPNLGEIGRDATRRQPGAIAYIELDGAKVRTITFSELDRHKDQVAHYLLQNDLPIGARVAIGIGNRIEFVEALFGSMRAGLVPVPVNIGLGEVMLLHVLRNAGCQAAIIEPGINSHFVSVVEKLGLPVKMALDKAPRGWNSYSCEMASIPTGFDAPALDEDSPAMLCYTSGSTGMPKGVVLTHYGQNWFVDCLVQHLSMLFSHRTRALVAVPLFHKNAMAGAIKPLLKVGGSVVIMKKFEPQAYIRALEQYECTLTSGVPAMYSLLLSERELLSNATFPSLQYLSIGSAPCAPALIMEIEERFRAKVLQGYGLTEGGPIVLKQEPCDKSHPIASCGRLIPGVEAKLINCEGLIDKYEGELWIRNPGITSGFVDLPEVTAKRLVNGWLSTGDLFRRDDSDYFYFLGRTDDLIVSSGENIYPAEVENILMQSAEVISACVVSLPHSVKGEVPGAMVVLAPSSKLSESLLRNFFLAHGPAYAHPRIIRMVEKMPMSGSGKIDRAAVKEALLKDWRT